MAQRPPCTDPAQRPDATGSAWVRAFAAGRRVEARPPLRQPAANDRPGYDVRAAWQRWHAPRAWAGFGPRERLFGLLFERVRVERLAALGWPGMAANLSDGERLAPDNAWLRPLYLCARHLAAGDRVAAEAMVDAWTRRQGTASAGARLGRWLRSLGAGSDPTRLSTDQAAALAACLRELLATDCWQPETLADGPAFARCMAKLVRRCGERLPVVRSAAVGADFEETGGRDSLLAEDAEDAPDDPDAPDAARLQDGLAEPEAPVERAYPGYAVFSQAGDETAAAGRWSRAGDRALLERLNRIDRRRARQLAHRLQRRLESARRRRWEFDQEDGLIDSRRLARLVQAGGDGRVFRRESPAPTPTAAVSLLVDMSGSMRGDRRLSAALAIDLAVHVLEICGVHCEVLGFTTAYADDNPVERAWRAAAGPNPPGRLNALRHVVFKGARQPWRRCRRDFGLLLREDFGHENIDGEALHWAAQRLFALDVSRRILVVLSDGAPFDQATAAANGRDYLCEHLRRVIARLEALPLHLLAMGTGTDVSRFYRNAVVLENPEAVAETLFASLGDLLTGPPGPRDPR